MQINRVLDFLQVTVDLVEHLHFGQVGSLLQQLLQLHLLSSVLFNFVSATIHEGSLGEGLLLPDLILESPRFRKLHITISLILFAVALPAAVHVAIHKLLRPEASKLNRTIVAPVVVYSWALRQVDLATGRVLRRISRPVLLLATLQPYAVHFLAGLISLVAICKAYLEYLVDESWLWQAVVHLLDHGGVQRWKVLSDSGQRKLVLRPFTLETAKVNLLIELIKVDTPKLAC